MLSRTADHLFWMARYIERAENTARMLDVNLPDVALLPQRRRTHRGSAGAAMLGDFSELTDGLRCRAHETVSSKPRSVIDFMVSDGRQSVEHLLSCLRATRENARAVRGALTTEAVGDDL